MFDRPQLNVRAKFDSPILISPSSDPKYPKYQESKAFEALINRYSTLRKKNIYKTDFSEPLQNYRYFILPRSWEEKKIQDYYVWQNQIDEKFYFITYSEPQARCLDNIKIQYSHFKKDQLFLSTLKRVKEDGHNQVMIEAGPKMTQFLLDQGSLDVLISVQSSKKSPFMEGRGFSASFDISQKDAVAGYQKILTTDLEEDRLSIWHSFNF